ncbi:cytoskeleton protein RodZ [Vibrio hangzhouensis]|uniref:cytoskeleton protein RodZ n=1 Tax=Vibrio hangzhouensis TaxID=462991 RepID=UPI001C95A6D3|nr:cytoskeleton protein RodZ [Vibrio hangzhouensis]MBY6199549.1 cytoskeleton protein RodZ [Vibrio hangzhouensis]
MSIEQHNPTDNTEDKSEVVLAGTILREKREALGLTQKQIADRLRLRVAIIQKIESNEFDGEQVATFTRGYLRSYAKAVGVDEHKVLGAVEPHGHAHHDEQPMQSFSKKTNKEKHDSRIMKLTWGIFIVIIGISSVWWLQNQQKDTLSEIAETSDPAFQVEEPAPEDAAISAALTIEEEPTKTLDVSTIIEQPQPEVVTEEAESLTSDAADEAATEMESAPVVTETLQPKPEQPKAENGLTNLTMTFNGDCWIQVKDANGKTVSTGIKKQGESLNLNGKAPFKVILGAPEKVSMTFASEPVDLSGYTSGKVARFTLP